MSAAENSELAGGPMSQVFMPPAYTEAVVSAAAETFDGMDGFERIKPMLTGKAVPRLVRDFDSAIRTFNTMREEVAEGEINLDRAWYRNFHAASDYLGPEPVPVLRSKEGCDPDELRSQLTTVFGNMALYMDRYTRGQGEPYLSFAANRAIAPRDALLGGIVHAAGRLVIVRAGKRLDTPADVNAEHPFTNADKIIDGVILEPIVVPENDELRTTELSKAILRQGWFGQPAPGLSVEQAALQHDGVVDNGPFDKRLAAQALLYASRI